MSGGTKQNMEMAIVSARSSSDREHSLSSRLSYHDSVLGSMHSQMSRSHSHSLDFSYHSDSSAEDEDHSHHGSNPKNWTWKQVSHWLSHHGMETFVPIFQRYHKGHGVDGHKLFELNRDVLLNEHPFDLNIRPLYKYTHEELANAAATHSPSHEHQMSGEADTGAKTNAGGEHLPLARVSNVTTVEDEQKLNENREQYTEDEKKKLISKLLMELAKLQTKNENFDADEELDFTHYNEIQRRFVLFVKKWQRILWIEHFRETTGELPTLSAITIEFGVTPTAASLYLETFANKSVQKAIDLKELFEGFNIYNDCIIWWKLCIYELKRKPRKSIWLIFEEIALFTPTKVGMQLLDHFQYDLTRFSEVFVNKICQNLVVGSEYPICAALMISKWMKDRADFDISRTEVFNSLAEDYVQAALEYLSLIESDHLATIMVEAKSDIDGMSAIDMALEFQIYNFVTDNRIERITDSMMTQWRFLDPDNKDESFQITPLSTDLFWEKIWTPQFYLTPLGQFATQLTLYLIYLGLFTYLSSEQFRVYDTMGYDEGVFWVFNIGYGIYEFFSLIDEGPKRYFAQGSNYFDFLISVIFITALVIRLIAVIEGPGCKGTKDNGQACWVDYPYNSAFVVLWGINTITLWLRLIYFTILSQTLGPMVRMIARMMQDIGTFLKIMLIIFFGFIVCLMFALGDILPDYSNIVVTFLTMFRAMMGDFDWDTYSEVSVVIRTFSTLVIIMYMTIAAVVLLNLLIAMMAKTFDSIEEETIAQIIFARFELAVELDHSSSYMPPPLNVFAMFFLGVFYVVELICNCIKKCCWCLCRCGRRAKDKDEIYIHFDLAVLLMPPFLRRRQLELDEQCLGKQFHLLTSEGDTKAIVTGFDHDLHHHQISFFEEKFSDNPHDESVLDFEVKKQVIVGNHVLKQHQWSVDLYDLSLQKIVNLHQFNDVVTAELTALYAYCEKGSKEQSKMWICSFCRTYAIQSDISVPRLARELNASEDEIRIVNRLSPVVCPNCYRYRHETDRWRLVWEIISLLMFYVMVWPILFLIFGLFLMIHQIQNPHELAHNMEMLSKFCRHKRKACHKKCNACCCAGGNAVEAEHASAATMATLRTMHGGLEVESDDDSSSDSDDGDDGDNGDLSHLTHKQQIKKQLAKRTKRKDYVGGHYSSHELIHALHSLDHDELFEHHIRHDLWRGLWQAKRAIDPYLLYNSVSQHIIGMSFEDEVTKLDFFDDFVNFQDLTEDGGLIQWETKFKPLASAIFKHIHDSREHELPLHLFSRFPFAPRMVLDEFEHWWHETKESTSKIPMNHCSMQDLTDFLIEFGSLRCKDEAEVHHLLERITASDDYRHEHAEIYDQFVAYLKETRSMFTETRKLQNLLRDISVAIRERGTDHEVVREEIDLIFEDIPSSIVGLPIFRSMKQSSDEIKLWTMRNFLKVISLLKQYVHEKMLSNHPHIYVTKRSLIRHLFTHFVHDIVDNKKASVISEYHLEDHEDSDHAADDEDSQVSEEDEQKHNTNIGCTDSDDSENDAEKRRAKRLALREKKKLGHESDEEDHDHGTRVKHRKRKVYLLHREQHRLKLMTTNRISASSVVKICNFIFDQIRESRLRKMKVTVSTIDHYQHRLMPIAFRTNDSLRFVYNQMCRYVIFHPHSLSQPLTLDKLTEILTAVKYDATHVIDEESAANIGTIERIHDVFAVIFDDAFNVNAMEETDMAVHFSQAASEAKDDETEVKTDEPAEAEEDFVPKTMTVEDGVRIILLYHRLFAANAEKLLASGDDFVVTRPVFLKFVDRQGYQPGMPKHLWSTRAKKAASMFQAALDNEQNFVTLGEIRQTIHLMRAQVDDMDCGPLTRIKNHLKKRVFKDNDRRIRKLPKYRQRMKKYATSMEVMSDEEAAKVQRPKNPALQYAMLNVLQWSRFISQISKHYVTKVDASHLVSDELHAERVQKHKNDNNYDNGNNAEADEDETPPDIFSRLTSVAICVVDKEEKKKKVRPKITIHEEKEHEHEHEQNANGNGANAADPSSKAQTIVVDMSGATNEAKVDGAEAEDEEEEKNGDEVNITSYKQTKDEKRMNRKYKIIFDTIIMKNEHRITVQQLLLYLRSLKRFLLSNKKLVHMIEAYEAAENEVDADADQLFHLENKLRHTKLGHYEQYICRYWSFECFKMDPTKNRTLTASEYAKRLSKRDREIRWLFKQCHSEFDIVNIVLPFLKGKIIDEIYELMHSSTEISGNSELRSEEFAQLKHQLRVNGTAAVNLFHIIRAHQQGVSWKQILQFMQFLDRIKKEVEESVRTHPRGTDADLTVEKMKLLLHISSMDEAKWLFKTVELHHADKLSWKHIRKYLRKSLNTRQEVRDFFDDRAKERDYDDNTADKFITLQSTMNNVLEIDQKMISLEENINSNMEEMRAGFTTLTQSLNALKEEMQP